jgi:hypothetical protein
VFFNLGQKPPEENKKTYDRAEKFRAVKPGATADALETDGTAMIDIQSSGHNSTAPSRYKPDTFTEANQRAFPLPDQSGISNSQDFSGEPTRYFDTSSLCFLVLYITPGICPYNPWRYFLLDNACTFCRFH